MLAAYKDADTVTLLRFSYVTSYHTDYSRNQATNHSRFIILVDLLPVLLYLIVEKSHCSQAMCIRKYANHLRLDFPGPY